MNFSDSQHGFYEEIAIHKLAKMKTYPQVTPPGAQESFGEATSTITSDQLASAIAIAQTSQSPGLFFLT